MALSHRLLADRYAKDLQEARLKIFELESQLADLQGQHAQTHQIGLVTPPSSRNTGTLGLSATASVNSPFSSPDNCKKLFLSLGRGRPSPSHSLEDAGLLHKAKVQLEHAQARVSELEKALLTARTENENHRFNSDAKLRDAQSHINSLTKQLKTQEQSNPVEIAALKKEIHGLKSSRARWRNVAQRTKDVLEAKRDSPTTEKRMNVVEKLEMARESNRKLSEAAAEIAALKAENESQVKAVLDLKSQLEREKEKRFVMPYLTLTI